MGNKESQGQAIEEKFELEQVECPSTKGVPKKHILVDEPSQQLIRCYLIADRSVEMIELDANPKPIEDPTQIRQPLKSISFTFQNEIFTSPILCAVLIPSSGQITQPKKSALLSLVFSDSKLAVLNCDDLKLVKTIQLFAPLEAFRISCIYDIEFEIQEDIHHKKRQQELMEELQKQREDFMKFFPPEKKSDDEDKEKEKEKENTTAVEEDPSFNEFLKARYDIFVQASKETAKGLLDIVDVCYSGKGIVLIGYACGLIQKVTVDKNMILSEEECVFFNPLNLKLRGEIQDAVTNGEGKVTWESLGILKLKQVLSVLSTYTITINQSEPSNSDKNQTKSLIYVFEHQHGKKVSYFEGPKCPIVKGIVNNSEGNTRSLIILLDISNQLSVYNYEKGTYLQQFELGITQQLPQIADFTAHFFKNHQIFSPLVETFTLLAQHAKSADRSIDGDILLFFTPDCKTLITQLDYTLVNATKTNNSNIVASNDANAISNKLRSNSAISIGTNSNFATTTASNQINSVETQPQSGNQVENHPTNILNQSEKKASEDQPRKHSETIASGSQTRKVLNQRMLKVFASKIPCKYRCSAYSPKTDTLFIVGEDSKLLRFSNFLASVFYYL